MESNFFWLAGGAFLGAIGAALLGWPDSGEPFNAMKFGKSVVHAFTGSLASVLLLMNSPFTTSVFVAAILIGAGVDVAANRAEGALAQRFGK